MSWEEAQRWEKEWHGTCGNFLYEELKQVEYAKRMGLVWTYCSKTPYNIDLNGASIIDIGGGPESLLLKCINGKGKVVDPLEYPSWVIDRYRTCGIEYERLRGEDIADSEYDEAWIYNCLQHTSDPGKVIENAKRSAKIIRLFEWIDTGVNIGHIHNLTKDFLDENLGGDGKVETFSGSGCLKGKAYYGIFRGAK